MGALHTPTGATETVMLSYTAGSQWKVSYLELHVRRLPNGGCHGGEFCLEEVVRCLFKTPNSFGATIWVVVLPADVEI